MALRVSGEAAAATSEQRKENEAEGQGTRILDSEEFLDFLSGNLTPKEVLSKKLPLS